MEDMDALKRVLGASVLAARERSGLTQVEVAEGVGLVSAVYGRIERGQMLPSVPTLFRLCMALGVSSDDLLGLDDTEREVLVGSPTVEASPELRRLEALVRTLSPAALRTLSAVATVVGR